MSGGSYDYAYHHISDLADSIENSLRNEDIVKSYKEPKYIYCKKTRKKIEDPNIILPITKLCLEARQWLPPLMEAIAKVAHDIEWIDSGDYGPGDELESIQNLLNVMKTTLEQQNKTFSKE